MKMKTKQILLAGLLLLCSMFIHAQKAKIYELKSPDGYICVKIEAGARIEWSVQHKGQQIIAPSAVSLTLQSGVVLGNNPRITHEKESVNKTINTLNYVKSAIDDIYNQLTLNCKGGYGLIFRAYNDAVAYRFYTRLPGEIIIKNEEANFNFTGDQKVFVPMQWDYRGGQIFNSSFENTYKEIRLSQFPKDSLAFLPALIDVEQNKKAELFEADLEDYPGMYIDLNQTGKGFRGVFAPYPLEIEGGGFNNLNLIPAKRADYIARTNGTRNFPWRAVVITGHDKDLLNASIVQKLASPSRISDTSWIKVGQVAWDWWNSMNISHVDFRAGENTETYKYFIDFAAR